MIHTKIKDVDLKFETESTIFSPHSIDNGTLVMLSQIDFSTSDKVLDLGCGYGVVGILAGKLIGEESVTMCDISEQAVKYATISAALNGVPHINIRLNSGYCREAKPDHKEEKEACKEIIQKITAEVEMLQSE